MIHETDTAGVLFDFDGVIVDSLPAHFLAWRDAVLEVFTQDPGDVTLLYGGHATPAFAAVLAKKFGDRNRAPQLARAKIRILTERVRDVKLMPGVEAALEILRKNNLPYGIASNAPRDFVRRIVRELALPVPVVLGREDATRGKPHPDLYLACAKLVGLTMHDHNKTLVFEDSRHGLKAAKRAGMIPIGVTSQHSASELLAAGATTTCANVLEGVRHRL